MAVVATAHGTILVSSDMLVDGVHFDSTKHDLGVIGRKAVCCGLSDCAAMAVEPVCVTVSVALPDRMDLSDAQQLLDGAMRAATEYEAVVVGGDTTRWLHPLVIDVAVTAQPYEGFSPIYRSGARLGDRLFVTGPLGGSILGRHLTFVPRVAEAKALTTALENRWHASIDISDGLSLDLSRVCEASGVGAELDEQLMETVISEDAKRLAKEDGVSALDHALSDGEDFELLLAVQEGPIPQKPALYPIGRIVDGGLSIRRKNGSLATLEPKGFLH